MAASSAPLRVASAFPDPPFEVSAEEPSGLDMDLMRAVADHLGRPFELHPYAGGDFEGIYDLLRTGDCDVVASGATVTDHRRTLARFCSPYLRSGQSLVVDTGRSPHVRSTADLTGVVVGVQRGNTSQPVVEALQAGGGVGGVRTYDYDAIVSALDDLASGAIGAFMKLEPVMRWLTRDRPTLDVVETGITDEQIAVAVRLDDDELAEGIESARRALAADGTLARLGSTWLAGSDPVGHRHGGRPVIRLVRLSTGTDGQSHVSEGEVDLAETGLDLASAWEPAAEVRFQESPPDAHLDWHDAPRRQYVITLTGRLEFTTRGGETFRLGPGDVLLAEDTAGGGHSWRTLDGEPWRRAYVSLDGPGGPTP